MATSTEYQQVSRAERGRRPVLDSYARLSRNLSGELEEVEDQHTDNRATIAGPC